MLSKALSVRSFTTLYLQCYPCLRSTLLTHLCTGQDSIHCPHPPPLSWPNKSNRKWSIAFGWRVECAWGLQAICPSESWYQDLCAFCWIVCFNGTNSLGWTNALIAIVRSYPRNTNLTSRNMYEWRKGPGLSQNCHWGSHSYIIIILDHNNRIMV